MAERLAAARIARQLSAEASSAAQRQASTGLRLLAYAVDTAVLFGFVMVFALAAFVNVFLRTDTGRTSVSDSVTWSSVIILMATIPVWLVFNLLLTRRRLQTVGHYVIGLRFEEETGAEPGLVRLVAYWLALHPLLFHPLLGGVWFLFAWVTITLAENYVVFVAFGALSLLCILAPLASLLFLLTDPQRRAIHDRLAGMRVVPLR
jgi:hypothetical protein